MNILAFTRHLLLLSMTQVLAVETGLVLHTLAGKPGTKQPAALYRSSKGGEGRRSALKSQRLSHMR
jgi:hypothetical protein